jgi:hypothetical protein
MYSQPTDFVVSEGWANILNMQSRKSYRGHPNNGSQSGGSRHPHDEPSTLLELGAQPGKSHTHVPRVLGARRIFLLSPANASGIRAQMIIGEQARCSLAVRLRNKAVSLGEIFSFISGLYFRGKLAYAQRFADVPPGVPGAFVITSSGGLIPPETLLNLEQLRQISDGSIDAMNSRYRAPLDRDLKILSDAVGNRCEIVLLGSVATPKYVEPLLAVFGERLHFPAEFAGRGDMSRGGLMLRCVRETRQLSYVPIATSSLHGPKPPKLPRITNSASVPGA